VAIRLAVDVMKRAQVTRHQIGWMKLIEHQDVGPDQNVGSDISKKQEKTVAWELRKNFLCVDVYIHIYIYIQTEMAFAFFNTSKLVYFSRKKIHLSTKKGGI